tara:strand:- start:1324 stop:2169 length:846 start_codon:yes stop_codon:yes gene_type:complete
MDCFVNSEYSQILTQKSKCESHLKLKALIFGYIATLSLKRDKLVLYFSMKALKYIYNINSLNAIDALHFVTIIPHYMNECQTRQIQPLLDAIDTIYYVNFYKNNIVKNNKLVEKLREEITIKERALRGIYGSVISLKLEVGKIIKDVQEISLQTLTGQGTGLSVSMSAGQVYIVKSGQNYQKGDVVYTTYFGGIGIFLTVNLTGSQDAAFQVSIDPVHAGLPIYVICYNYNARITHNYDLEILNLIQYESCQYGNDYIVKKYIVSHQKMKEEEKKSKDKEC